MKLNSVLIGSENADRLASYYTKLFGAPGWTMESYTGWQIGEGFVTVGPHDEVKGTNPSPGRIIWNIESTDVAADFARFQAAGAIVIREPYTMGESGEAWICTFADPDGNYFQLLSPVSM
jgi:predicted enzyme related to lactoylglutathione lyase